LPGPATPGRGQERVAPFFASAQKVKPTELLTRRAVLARLFDQLLIKKNVGHPHHHTPKPVVPVPVVGIVPVAVSAASGPFIIVERTAAQHPEVVFNPPPQHSPAGPIVAN